MVVLVYIQSLISKHIFCSFAWQGFRRHFFNERSDCAIAALKQRQRKNSIFTFPLIIYIHNLTFLTKSQISRGFQYNRSFHRSVVQRVQSLLNILIMGGRQRDREGGPDFRHPNKSCSDQQSQDHEASKVFCAHSIKEMPKKYFSVACYAACRMRPQREFKCYISPVRDHTGVTSTHANKSILTRTVTIAKSTTINK